MTAEELLKPRYEVIADYPNNPHKIGDVIQANPNQQSIHLTTISYANDFGDRVNQQEWAAPTSFDKYPHLFRKLNWWEHRKVEDMPKKLISMVDKDNPEKMTHKEIIEIQGWDMEHLIGWIDEKERSCCSLLAFNPEYGYFPVD